MVKLVVDFVALGGLRGFTSLWIVFYHYLGESAYPIKLFAIVQIFYMLSGFTLVIAYGFRKANDSRKSSGDNKIITWPFFRNRLARVLPVYYFTLLLAIPLCFIGFGSMDLVDSITNSYFLYDLLVNVVPVDSWFQNVWNVVSINFPSWTVSTLIFMWIFFPFMNTILQSKSDEIILRFISCCYWFNISFVVFGLYSPYPGSDFFTVYGLFTTNPITRFPLFLIGMCAGILCIRHSDDIIPWPDNYFLLFPSYFNNNPQESQNPTFTVAGAAAQDDNENQPLIRIKNNITIDTFLSIKASEKVLWAKRADVFGILFILTAIFTSVALTLFNYLGWDPQNPVGLVDCWNLKAIVNSIICFAQISLIVSLVRGVGSEQPSWILDVMRSDIAQWLGERSMCIYLVHWPVIRYFLWIKYGGETLTKPTSYTCSEYDTTTISGLTSYNNCESTIENYYTALEAPLWAIPILICVSLIFSHFLYHFIEEPGRKLFSWKPPPKNIDEAPPVPVPVALV